MRGYLISLNILSFPHLIIINVIERYIIHFKNITNMLGRNRIGTYNHVFYLTRKELYSFKGSTFQSNGFGCS